MICPNCGSEESQFCDSLVKRRCVNCGTWWSTNTGEIAFVPRRSQPATVLPLPDVTISNWWCREEKGVWTPFYVPTNWEPPVGRYVVWQPPIISPPQKRDADADWLRAEADTWKFTEPAVKERMYRIAGELERLKRKEREE